MAGAGNCGVQNGCTTTSGDIGGKNRTTECTPSSSFMGQWIKIWEHLIQFSHKSVFKNQKPPLWIYGTFMAQARGSTLQIIQNGSYSNIRPKILAVPPLGPSHQWTPLNLWLFCFMCKYKTFWPSFYLCSICKRMIYQYTCIFSILGTLKTEKSCRNFVDFEHKWGMTGLVAWKMNIKWVSDEYLLPVNILLELFYMK